MKKRVLGFVLLAWSLSLLPLVFAFNTNSSVSVEFTSQNGSCTSTADTSYWSIGATKIWTVSANGNTSDCFYKSPLTGEYDYNISCCPSSWDACVESDDHPGGICVPDVGLCSNLGSNASCRSAKHVAERSLQKSEVFGWYVDSKGGICWTSSIAACVWENVTKNITNADGSFSMKSMFECTADYINKTGINATDYDGNCTETPSTLSCIEVYMGQEEKCDVAGGGIYVNYTAWIKNMSENADQTKQLASSVFPSVSSWCNDSVKKYECSASIQLPFFTMTNFLISLLAIAGVYAFLKRNSLEVV